MAYNIKAFINPFYLLALSGCSQSASNLGMNNGVNQNMKPTTSQAAANESESNADNTEMNEKLLSLLNTRIEQLSTETNTDAVKVDETSLLNKGMAQMQCILDENPQVLRTLDENRGPLLDEVNGRIQDLKDSISKCRRQRNSFNSNHSVKNNKKIIPVVRKELGELEQMLQEELGRLQHVTEHWSNEMTEAQEKIIRCEMQFTELFIKNKHNRMDQHLTPFSGLGRETWENKSNTSRDLTIKARLQGKLHKKQQQVATESQQQEQKLQENQEQVAIGNQQQNKSKKSKKSKKNNKNKK